MKKNMSLKPGRNGIVVSAGISKGAELALISATYFDEINGVIAFSPGYDKFFRMGRKHLEKCRKTATTLYKEVEEWLHKL